MASSLIPDPLQMWRDALTQLESNVNSFVTGSLDSRDLVRSVHQLSAVSTGLQQAFEKAIGSYLAKVNLPSRKDVAELAEALRRIEDKVDRLAPPDAAHAMPRPARTRRPPDAEPTAAAPAASAKATAAARPRRPAAKRTSARAGSRS